MVRKKEDEMTLAAAENNSVKSNDIMMGEYEQRNNVLDLVVETHSSDGPFTVFATTNDAFYALLNELGFRDDIGEIPVIILTKVLLSHVVAGNITSDVLDSGYVQTLNENKSIMIDVTDGGVTIDESINVILTDVQGTNGVIHVIDGVILPAIPTAERDYTDM
jgi:transforming growth factor-beta-induced protein